MLNWSLSAVEVQHLINLLYFKRGKLTFLFFFLYQIRNFKIKIQVMRYVVIVAYRVFPDKRESFFNLVRKEADALVQNELGTLHVTNMIDQIDPNKFLNLKIFESKEAYEEHKNGLILKAFLQEADEMVIEGPNVIFEGIHMYSCDDYTLEQKSGEDMTSYFKR